jgi:hypothetical protein
MPPGMTTRSVFNCIHLVPYMSPKSIYNKQIKAHKRFLHISIWPPRGHVFNAG